MTAPATKLQVVSVPAANPAQQPADDELIDSRVEKLRLVGTVGRKDVASSIVDALTDGQIEDSFLGAPQLTVDVIDRDFSLLNSGVFDDTVEVELDGVPYVLVEPQVTDVNMLELLFEHKIVNELRKQKGPLKANRTTTTRAQFIEMMLREIAPSVPGLTFVCPEVNTRQKVTAAKKSGRSLKTKTLSSSTTVSTVRSSGFGLSHLSIRDWDGSTVVLGPAQLQNAATVLQVCQQDQAPAKAVLAAMEACIVEPSPPFGNPSTATDHTSTGILQLLSTTAQGYGLDPLNVAGVVDGFLKHGYWGKGGAIQLAQQNPTWSAGQIAQACQGSGFPSRYDMAQQGAMTVINAFSSGPGGGDALTSSILQTLPISGKYEFSRGLSGQAEDSYTCCLRLAREVNWRFFIAGRTYVYFVTDDDLLESETVYRIDPRTPGVVRCSFQVEQGGRTIVRHGKRVPKPSTASVQARVDRWFAPPGSVVELERYGPGNGQWLVSDITRKLFDRDATITLEAPQQPTAEPSATSGSSSSASVSLQSPAPIPGQTATPSSNSPVDTLYAACQWMNGLNLPYGPAGHTGAWATALRAPNQDCSSSTSIVLYLAGMMGGYAGPIVSSQFDGWAAGGKGQQFTVWYIPQAQGSSGHVFIQFYGRPASRFDTVPGGSGGLGPHLRYTAPGSPSDLWEANGFLSRHWPGL